MTLFINCYNTKGVSILDPHPKCLDGAAFWTWEVGFERESILDIGMGFGWGCFLDPGGGFWMGVHFRQGGWVLDGGAFWTCMGGGGFGWGAILDKGVVAILSHALIDSSVLFRSYEGLRIKHSVPYGS